ncbi:hypothetical protein HPB47_009801 [Ixodes persulcatus]|uniref:Uncharacterized protein n=1 Tax=Ixodes persulcatus TaxID=34615 RepID=A0AC60P0U0_IXOPE|nr:hypothetical protein HPB47_009801 [Ixodes persulcatus]
MTKLTDRIRTTEILRSHSQGENGREELPVFQRELLPTFYSASQRRVHLERSQSTAEGEECSCRRPGVQKRRLAVLILSTRASALGAKRIEVGEKGNPQLAVFPTLDEQPASNNARSLPQRSEAAAEKRATGSESLPAQQSSTADTAVPYDANSSSLAAAPRWPDSNAGSTEHPTQASSSARHSRAPHVKEHRVNNGRSVHRIQDTGDPGLQPHTCLPRYGSLGNSARTERRRVEINRTGFGADHAAQGLLGHGSHVRTRHDPYTAAANLLSHGKRRDKATRRQRDIAKTPGVSPRASELVAGPEASVRPSDSGGQNKNVRRRGSLLLGATTTTASAVGFVPPPEKT